MCAIGKIKSEKFYTPDELAERYNVNKRTIERIIQEGNRKGIQEGALVATRIGKRTYRIKGEDSIKYEKDNRTIK